MVPLQSTWPAKGHVRMTMVVCLAATGFMVGWYVSWAGACPVYLSWDDFVDAMNHESWF